MIDKHGEPVRENYRRQGEVRERERIIKLLEADICPNATWDCCDRACWAYKDAVALIKGENK